MDFMGRRGRYILKAPFDTLAPQGAQGTVIESVDISHLVSIGFDVLVRVYERVNAANLYAKHVADDVTIITIQLDDGSKITVPTTYVENLNDISLHYLTGYLTVRVGQLPADYDYHAAKVVIANEVSRITGVQVEVRDVALSVSGKDSVFYTPEEAAFEEVRRRAAVEGVNTDYARVIALQRENDELREQILALEASIINLSKTA